jgi:hypothetical protein
MSVFSELVLICIRYYRLLTANRFDLHDDNGLELREGKMSTARDALAQEVVTARHVRLVLLASPTRSVRFLGMGAGAHEFSVSYQFPHCGRWRGKPK